MFFFHSLCFLCRGLPTDNDGGIYLYMTAFGIVTRMNATPHRVSADMSSSVRYSGPLHFSLSDQDDECNCQYCYFLKSYCF